MQENKSGFFCNTVYNMHISQHMQHLKRNLSNKFIDDIHYFVF